MATKKQQHEGAFKDISAAVEQADADAQQPALDPKSGEPNAQVSEAAAEVAAEVARRASGQSNGGGPWPTELLRERGTTQTRLRRPTPEYTSHEVDHA